ncbi:hypothetical protein RJT34_16314 [Clitoria ternatea]|uniref:Uncharacterized protein n=1 Tax=Clitoria ternatea TaxID=43366 RepID=A0AAN9PC74_CLITE
MISVTDSFPAPRSLALPAWYRPPIGVSRLLSSSYGYHVPSWNYPGLGGTSYVQPHAIPHKHPSLPAAPHAAINGSQPIPPSIQIHSEFHSSITASHAFIIPLSSALILGQSCSFFQRVRLPHGSKALPSTTSNWDTNSFKRKEKEKKKKKKEKKTERMKRIGSGNRATSLFHPEKLFNSLPVLSKRVMRMRVKKKRNSKRERPDVRMKESCPA